MHEKVKQEVRARDDEALALEDALELETARARKLQEIIDSYGGAGGGGGDSARRRQRRACRSTGSRA